MATRREVISSIRTFLKEHTSDTDYTNRALWNIYWRYASLLIKREINSNRSFFFQNGKFQTICIDMEPVDTISCNLNIDNCKTIYRSTEKLPEFFHADSGIVYSGIRTPDDSITFNMASLNNASKLSKIKYSDQKYAFVSDGYLFTPNAKYPHLKITALFNGVVCTDGCKVLQTKCNKVMDTPDYTPDYLTGTAIQMVIQDLAKLKQLPIDDVTNQSSNQKQSSI